MFVKANKKYRQTLTVLLLLLTIFSKAGETKQDSTRLMQNFEKAKELRYTNVDSATILMQKVFTGFMARGDTLQAINILLEMPYARGQQVNYADTYDDLWKALFLADDLNNDALRASIYNQLGRLYSFFKKREEAFKYLNTALKINQGLVEKGLLDDSELGYNYYLLGATYRELGEPELAKMYLDSISIGNSSRVDRVGIPYLNFEKAFVLSQENQNTEALELFQEIEPWFIENRPSYLVLVYTYWGDAYASESESEKLYLNALDASGKYNSHLDFIPLIHERLAKLYQRRGDFEKALANLQRAKEIDAQFFDSRSEKNRSLLEIKDEFRLEKERQERVIQNQRMAQLEQEDEILLLQWIILAGALVFLILIGLIYLRQLRARHKAEKQLIQRSKELEIQKAKELLELKNKELATSALQLVEKDEFLKEIKNRLKGENGNIKTTEINQVLKSISHSNQNNWEEFKLRFTSVNEKFYNKVTNQYPKLSQADQKICALIKLNFSSKEMARLLGISVESVHTTRYRLRKKMGLDRSVNLEEFIANL